MKDEFIQKDNHVSAFPKGVHFTPVPSPLLGPLLKQVSSYNELVCILRLISLIHLKKNSLNWIEQNLLISDDILQSIVGSTGQIIEVLDNCIEKGLVLRTSLKTDSGIQILLLNTFNAKSNLDRIIQDVDATSFEVVENNHQTENIFGLYQNNIGTLNPLITEELKHAQNRYPKEWIQDAFREAVVNNARSWRYIQSILKNWDSSGRGQSTETDRRKSGRNRRHIKEAGQRQNKRY